MFIGMKRIFLAILAAASLLAASSCSTTRALQDGEYRLRRNKIEVTNDDEFNTNVLTPYIKQRSIGWTPFMTVYNWTNGKGKAWDKLVQKVGVAPVVYDASMVDESIEGIEKHLEHLGYYGSKAESQINVNKRRVDVTYKVTLGKRFPISDINITLPSRGEFREAFLADTSANEKELDNHKDREEVRDAFASGKGSSVRYSDTLMKKTIYYATLLEDGTVLRVSTTQDSVIIILLGLLYPIIIILVIVLILTLYLSHRVSKSIITPLNNLDLDNPENNETYEELTPLLTKVASQKRKINEQLKAAEQRQEEFRLITENMTEGFLVIDHNTNLLTYNSSALRLLDIKEVQKGSVLAVNRTKGFRDVVHKVLRGEHAESTINIDEKHYELIEEIKKLREVAACLRDSEPLNKIIYIISHRIWITNIITYRFRYR